MALEAVVYPQGLLDPACKELYIMGGGSWCYELGEVMDEDEKGKVVECEIGSANGCWSWSPHCWTAVQNLDECDANTSPPTVACRRKRRRTAIPKNKEEAERQRMTHIELERNRRKQMNNYLATLQSMFPPSYLTRSDQASIVSSAINYVKELEQLVQSLEAQKHMSSTMDLSSPFSDFFNFPQYSSSHCSSNSIIGVEVTMVEDYASARLLLMQRPKQLLRMVEGLQSLRLMTVHLNVTTVDEMVLYSFSLKVEDDCRCRTADEIAAEVNQMIRRIHEMPETIII